MAKATGCTGKIRRGQPYRKAAGSGIDEWLGLMPAGAVLLYTPKNRVELAVCYIGKRLIQVFLSSPAPNVADFCLEIYRQMGLFVDIRVVRSSAADFRAAASEIPDFFVDVPYEGEIVRARFIDGALKLHEGGESFVTLPPTVFTKKQISPTRDTRFRWMQSVVNCSHYICGASEKDYLRPESTPDVNFINRELIDRFDEVYTEFD
jgi:hypothetical protein